MEGSPQAPLPPDSVHPPTPVPSPTPRSPLPSHRPTLAGASFPSHSFSFSGSNSEIVSASSMIPAPHSIPGRLYSHRGAFNATIIRCLLLEPANLAQLGSPAEPWAGSWGLGAGIFPFSALYLRGGSAQALSSSSAPVVTPALGLGSASSFVFLFCSSLCSGGYLLLITNRFRSVVIEASGEDTEQAVPLIQTQRDPERTFWGRLCSLVTGTRDRNRSPLAPGLRDEPHTFRTRGGAGGAGGFPLPPIWASQILCSPGPWLFIAFSGV